MVKVVCSTVLSVPVEDVWKILRGFNRFDVWHPAMEVSQIERGDSPDRVGCIRKFRLADGSELREQLLALSDEEKTLSYCLLDTPIPLFNYVSHISLLPVTDSNGTFWEWKGRFDVPKGSADELTELVSKHIYNAGFQAIRKHFETQQTIDNGPHNFSRVPE